MASPSIEQIVAQIRTAIFGKDVRENIALGIEKCYDDAQGTTLNSKINDLNTILSISNCCTIPYESHYNAIGGSSTYAGITITYKGNGIFHVQGTATASSFENLVVYDGIPNGFVGGQTVHFKFECKSGSLNGLGLRAYTKPTKGGEDWTTLFYRNSSNPNLQSVSIPANTQGILLRLEYTSGNTYNLDVEVYMCNKSPNYIHLEKDMMASNGALVSDRNLNNATKTGFYLLTDDGGATYQNKPTNADDAGFLFVYNVSDWCYQVHVGFNTNAGIWKRRGSGNGSSWNAWTSIGNCGRGIKAATSGSTYNLNNANETGWYILGDEVTWSNKPIGMGGAGLLHIVRTDDIMFQILMNFSNGKTWQRHAWVSSPTTWSDWTDFGGAGGGNTYNITNNNTFPEYSQTLTVTSTPTITSDTNNYLAPSGDNTDRTSDILTMLQINKVCRLGGGKYVVSNLQMPDNTMIIGSGSSTEIRLAGTSNGFAIKLGSKCTVKDVRIVGADSKPSFSSTQGGRYGLIWQGEYTESQVAPLLSMINGVYIENFSGAGLAMYDTGYGTYNGVAFENGYIRNCWAGIDISYWSEFNKFTNVRCGGCRIGCINNGGNNVFVNCDFSSNDEIAMLMDNSQGTAINNTHGSCIGCVFNHTASGGTSNNGIGIKIINCNNGFAFVGCQIFFSKIDLLDTSGITFSDCVFGYSNCDISVENGGAVLFIGNMFQDKPPITVTSKTHFVNNYNRTSGAIIEP